ncbi:hypothetical protein ABIC08_009248 [Bradyrhizobium sp. RT9b]
MDRPHGQSICRTRSATGIACTPVSATGRRWTCGSACLTRPRTIPTGNTPWSTPPSSRSTATGRSQKGTQSQAIGRSKGGLTTKVLALTDALGNLVRFVLLPGQRFDAMGVPPLIEGGLRREDRRQGVRLQRHHRRTRRTAPRSSSPNICVGKASRHGLGDMQMAAPHRKLLRQAQGVQSIDKIDQSFASMIHLPAAVINSRWIPTELALKGLLS